MKALSGREATLLALLAQNPALPESDKRRVLKQLNGQALSIAKTIVGTEKRPTDAMRAAAAGFSSWAKGYSAATG